MNREVRDFKIEIVSAHDADEYDVIQAARTRRTWSPDSGTAFRTGLMEDVQRNMSAGNRRCEEYEIVSTDDIEEALWSRFVDSALY